ncbi:hypothetical protein FACS189425_07620 [Clostridia bacterium]|nr:hypothetical protein FACS189425_07620 [Clostridia bacterium]
MRKMKKSISIVLAMALVFALIPVKNSGEVDARTIHGKWLIDVALDYATVHPFVNGIAVVENAGKMGAIDKQGRLAVPVSYTFVDKEAPFTNTMAIVKNSDNTYSYINVFVDVLSLPAPTPTPTPSVSPKPTAAPSPTPIVLKFQAADEFCGDYAVVQDSATHKWGVIKKNGILAEVNLAYEYDAATMVREVNRVVLKKGTKYALYNPATKAVTAFNYDSIDSYSAGENMIPATKGGKYGMLAANGTEKVAFEYDIRADYSGYIGGYAALVKNGKWGVINSAGTKVTEFVYKSVHKDVMFRQHRLAVQSYDDSKWGFINEAGTQIVPYRYNNVRDYVNDVAAVQWVDNNQNLRWGYITDSTNVAINAQTGLPNNVMIRNLFVHASDFDIGLAFVQTDGSGKYGGINKDGNTAFPFMLDEEPELIGNYVLGVSNTRVGLWPRTGGDLKIGYVDDPDRWYVDIYPLPHGGFYATKQEIVNKGTDQQKIVWRGELYDNNIYMKYNTYPATGMTYDTDDYLVVKNMDVVTTYADGKSTDTLESYIGILDAYTFEEVQKIEFDAGAVEFQASSSRLGTGDYFRYTDPYGNSEIDIIPPLYIDNSQASWLRLGDGVALGKAGASWGLVSLKEGLADASTPTPTPTPTPTQSSTTTGDSSNNTGGGGGGSTPRPTATPKEVNEPEPTETVNSASSNFTDIDGHWAEKAIKSMINKGIINGYELPDDQFEFLPNKNITRAEFSKLLMGLSGDKQTGSQYFIDAPSWEWYAPYVAWASSNGITSGYEDNTFRPGINMTREEMAIMLDRFCTMKKVKLTTKNTKGLQDGYRISNWAEVSVSKMYTAGIINGDDYGNFNPKKQATRAETVTMLYNLNQKL